MLDESQWLLFAIVNFRFFKTIVLPNFDYCSSLVVYFPKRAIQKLANTYNSCLAKLLNLKDYKDLSSFNLKLESFKLNSFQHRVVSKISIFINKIISLPSGPTALKTAFIKKEDESATRLRNGHHFIVPKVELSNNYGFNTFGFLFVR